MTPLQESVFIALVFLFIVTIAGVIVWFRVRLGPAQLPARRLAKGRRILRVEAGDPGAGWSECGEATEADGLDLRFSAKDVPDAAALLRLPGEPVSNGVMTNRHPVRLERTPRRHHVHSGGFVFRTSLAGEPEVEGRRVVLVMELQEGRPAAVGIENDRELDPARGGWIRVEWLEVLDVRPLGRHPR